MPQNQELLLYDIYDLWYVPFWRTSWFCALVGFCVVAVLIAVVFFLVRWYRRWREHKKPWERALVRVQKLSQRYGRQADRHYHQAYAELIEILKSYIEIMCFVSLVSKTDQECIAYLRSVTQLSELQHLLNALFSTAQTMKFSPQKDADDQWHRDVERVKSIIEHLKAHRTIQI